MTTPIKPAANPEEHIVGAAPPGARDEAAAAEAVREMFTSIAPRYDLLNHVLSMNVDRVWWNRTARVFSEVLRRPGAEVLDLCCGTGDMAFALYRRLEQLQSRCVPVERAFRPASTDDVCDLAASARIHGLTPPEAVAGAADAALKRRSTRTGYGNRGAALDGASTRITGADFSHAMLVRAEEKSAGKNIRWVEADALNLPFATGQFQLVTSAFG